MRSLPTETQYNHVLAILQNEHGCTKNLIKKYSGEYVCERVLGQVVAM